MELKICGIKNFKDAKMCLDAGANTLGFLVGQTHSSNDFISVETAKSIIEKLKPRKFYAQLVTHLTDGDEIIRIVREGGFNSIQFHSDITDLQVQKVRKVFPQIRIVRLIHISETGEIASNLNQLKIADVYLLDSFNITSNQIGGTGKTHNWHTSAELVKKLEKPVVLAGGLNPNNIAEAIRIVKPFGVDVNSGVKNKIGFKDKQKVIAFIKNAKQI